jgi:hypothetical protein
MNGKPKYGYNINTGEPIHNYEERLIYIGGGNYKKACDVTEEDMERKKRWMMSIDSELHKFKLGLEES